MNEQQWAEGWYQDGQDPTLDRWWDGAQWTGATRPRGGPAAMTAERTAPAGVTAAEPRKKRHRVRNAFLVVIGVIVLIAIIQAATGGDDAETPATTQGMPPRRRKKSRPRMPGRDSEIQPRTATSPSS